MEWLPNEVLTRILSELDQASLGRCAQLNRRWQRLATQPHLWRKIRLDGLKVHPELMQRLCEWLGEKLWDISAHRITSEHKMTQLLAATANLTSLSLLEMEGDSILKVAGRCCHSLKELRLEQCDFMFSFESVSGLLAGCPDLSLLEYKGRLSDLLTPSDEDRVVPLFHTLLSRLRSLTMRLLFLQYLPHPWFAGLLYSPRLVSLTICISHWRGLSQLQHKVPNLKDLTILCSKPPSSTDLQLSKLPHLRRLAICDVSKLEWNSDLLILLLQNFPELCSFWIDCCVQFEGASYRQFIQALPPGLVDLRLGGCAWSDVPAAELREPLPFRLERLQLTRSEWKISGTALIDALVGCSGLTHLALGICTDSILPVLLTRLPRLRCLRLTDCSRLTRQAWTNLRHLQSPAASPPELLEFWALECNQARLTDEAVADLCASPVARGLRRVFLSQSGQLTAVALAKLSAGCPLLTHLALKPLPRISLADLRKFRAAFAHHVEVELERVPHCEWTKWPC